MKLQIQYALPSFKPVYFFLNFSMTLKVVLFSMLNLDPTAPHTLTVYNLPDVRFAKSGEITFQSIILNTDDGENDNGGDNAGDLGPDGCK